MTHFDVRHDDWDAVFKWSSRFVVYVLFLYLIHCLAHP